MFDFFKLERNDFKYLFLMMLIMLFMANDAFAGTSSTSMPYDGVLEKFVDSLTGSVAYAIVIAGIFLAGVGIIFGGELAQWVKSLSWVVLAGSSMIFAGQILSTLFGTSAVLPEQISAQQLENIIFLSML